MDNDCSYEEMCNILKLYLQYHDKYIKIYGEKTIVIINVGNWYEIYAVINDELNIHEGPDLNEISDILNIQIARRNKKIKEINYDNYLMAGFPDHAYIKYRNILLNNNFTIVKVDQTTPPPNPEREVTEIISPSTVIDSYNKSDTNNLVSLYINTYPAINNHKIYSEPLDYILV